MYVCLSVCLCVYVPICLTVKYVHLRADTRCTPSTILLMVIVIQTKLENLTVCVFFLFWWVYRWCTACLRDDGDHTVY